MKPETALYQGHQHGAWSFLKNAPFWSGAEELVLARMSTAMSRTGRLTGPGMWLVLVYLVCRSSRETCVPGGPVVQECEPPEVVC